MIKIKLTIMKYQLLVFNGIIINNYYIINYYYYININIGSCADFECDLFFCISVISVHKVGWYIFFGGPSVRFYVQTDRFLLRLRSSLSSGRVFLCLGFVVMSL